MRYEETAGGLVRKAFGITEPDRAAVVERAEEIRALVDKTHRVSLGTSYEMSPESAEAVAAAELGARPLIDTDKAEWDQRMRSTDPFWYEPGKMSMADGICWTTAGPGGETIWHGGSPQMRAAVAESRRRDLERAQVMAAGPFAAQIR